MSNFKAVEGVVAGVIVILAVAGAFVAGSAVGSRGTVPYQEVVNRGLAYYHPKTAEFTWNTSATTAMVVGAQK